MKNKKVYIIVSILILLLVISVAVYSYKIKSKSEIKDTTINEKENIDIIDNINNEDMKTIENCRYKAFSPKFENINGYDYTQDMEYKDKIYHKVITTFDEYVQYKNRWSDILNMAEDDFENSFMVITAIENTSMLGLTISNIYTNENTLFIELDSYKDNEEYDENETCISIIIPKNMKRENIEVKDIRTKQETAKYDYGWKNESTEGLSMISKDEAIEIAKKYAKELSTSNSLAGKWLANYTKVFEVSLTEVNPNNYWYITEGIIERNLVIADFKRVAYEVILLNKDDEVEVERAFFYVDAYTGQVIAGKEMSD